MMISLVYQGLTKAMSEYQTVVCSDGETKEMELYVGPFPEARLLSRDHQSINNTNIVSTLIMIKVMVIIMVTLIVKVMLLIMVKVMVKLMVRAKKGKRL